MRGCLLGNWCNQRLHQQRLDSGSKYSLGLSANLETMGLIYWSALADDFRTFMLNRDIFELALSRRFLNCYAVCGASHCGDALFLAVKAEAETHEVDHDCGEQNCAK